MKTKLKFTERQHISTAAEAKRANSFKKGDRVLTTLGLGTVTQVLQRSFLTKRKDSWRRKGFRITAVYEVRYDKMDKAYQHMFDKGESMVLFPDDTEMEKV